VAEGFYSRSIRDWQGKISHFGFRVPELTAENFDAEYAKYVTFHTASKNIILGKPAGDRFGIVYPRAAVVATPTATRRLKWRVLMRDTITGEDSVIEVGTANPELLDPNSRKLANRDQEDISYFISQLEGYALSPDGNAITVVEIRLVGRIP
jgi:hypothetical protein